MMMTTTTTMMIRDPKFAPSPGALLHVVRYVKI